MANSTKKKILHTTTRLVLGGGVEKNIFYSIAGLKEEFDFDLSCGADCQDTHFAEEAGCRSLHICKDLVNTIHPIKDVKAIWYYYRLIRRERYDIVHTHETKASLITRIAAWLAGCPYIIYGLHGVTFNDPMSKWKRKIYIAIEKYTVGCADLIVSVGRNTIEAYLVAGIGRKIPYRIIRSGIDVSAALQSGFQQQEERLAFRRSIGLADKDLVLVTVGRFSFSKAQRYSIRAFARLLPQYPHLKLVLLGEGELLNECRQLAVDLGIPNDRIVFAGYQPNVPAYLAASDIFVFTSLREGLPRVIVEAALMRLPVVCFEVEGANEVIVNKESGFIVPQYDETAFVSALEHLILQPALRAAFAEKAFQHVVEEWDKSNMVLQLREIYNRNYIQ